MNPKPYDPEESISEIYLAVRSSLELQETYSKKHGHSSTLFKSTKIAYNAQALVV